MIGIFDSGVGGLTVAHAIEQTLPDHSLIYLGDLARTPYGSKSDAAIIEYSRENTRFLLDKGAQVIVIACNSAASVATDTLRAEFSVPILEVVTPAVALAVCSTISGRIGLIGTRATVRSNVYTDKIGQLLSGCKVYPQACPLLVPLVEECWLHKRETKMILRRYLHPLRDKQIDTLVLGCTHYPLLKHLIGPRIGKRVTLVDSSAAMANSLKRFLADQPGLCREDSIPERRYFVTDLTETAAKVATSIFKRNITLLRT